MLIADIEPDFNKSLKNLFDRLGYTAYTADTKEEALNIVKEHKPDIIIIDVREKPHYTLRLDVLRTIKEMDDNVRIIVVTTHEKEDVDIIKAVGIDGYFDKPLNLEKLLAHIKKN